MIEYSEEDLLEMDDLSQEDFDLLEEIPNLKCAHCGRTTLELNGTALLPDDFESENPKYYCEAHSKLVLTQYEKEKIATLQYIANPVLL